MTTHRNPQDGQPGGFPEGGKGGEPFSHVFVDRILAITQGNPGAFLALSIAGNEVLRRGGKALEFTAEVEASNLRGPDLHVAFKDECHSDPAAFVRLIGLLAASPGGAR